MSEAPSEDLKAVLARLADLQVRMLSLEQKPRQSTGLGGMDAQLARQMVEAQNLRDTMKDFEEKQARIFDDFLGGAGAYATDIVQVLDKRLFPRLDVMFAGAKEVVTERVSLLTMDRFAQHTDRQMQDFEVRFEGSIQQFSAIREKFQGTELKLLDATERMDAIWADQEVKGIGGWRMVMRAVSAFVDRNREQQPPDPFGHFRRPEDVSGPSLPAITQMHCPKCYRQEVRRLHRNTLLEEMMRVLFVAPYRCHACSAKFYRMRLPAS